MEKKKWRDPLFFPQREIYVLDYFFLIAAEAEVEEAPPVFERRFLFRSDSEQHLKIEVKS